MKTFKFGDIILIVFIIVVSLIIALSNTKKSGKAIIEVDGEVIKSVDLSVDSQFVYEGKYKNLITVKDGKIFVSNSNCPEKNCVYSGAAQTSLDIICCLPNNLLIRITDSNEKVDVISG